MIITMDIKLNPEEQNMFKHFLASSLTGGIEEIVNEEPKKQSKSVKPAKAKTEKEETVKPETEESDEEPVSLDEFKAIVTELAATEKRKEVTKIVKKYGKCVSDVKPQDRAKAIAELKTLEDQQ